MRKPFCDICGKEITTQSLPDKYKSTYAAGNLVAELVVRSADCGHADVCHDCMIRLSVKLTEQLQEK